MRNEACFSMPVILMILSVASCSDIQQDTVKIEHYNSPYYAAMNLPFSEAVRVGNTLYLSGQIGNKPGEMEVVPGGISVETRQALDNIKGVLMHYDADLSNVVKCTVFLADINEWPAMNAVYKEYFTKPYPARSAVAGSGLAIGARVEIECIAYLGED